MSFAFGFGGDDIEEEEEERNEASTEKLAQNISQVTISEPPPNAASVVIPPQRHSLQELLSSLPSQISYNTLSIPATHPSDSAGPPAQTPCPIQRRAHFDILAQLMAESSPSSSPGPASSTDQLIASLQRGDLTSGLYEGGFKTWECAVDLASLVWPLVPADIDMDIVELGCGTALPSLALLRAVLACGSRDAKVHVTLCDYNVDVLRLATAPNVLLNVLAATGGALEASQGDGDLDVEGLGPSVLDDVATTLKERGVEVEFVSGAWGSEFGDLVGRMAGRRSRLMVLASETIYSPGTLGVFTDTLLSLLREGSRREGGATAWVAAKKVYFGVGGGVDEFVRCLEGRGARWRVLWETGDGVGVGRVVGEVSLGEQ